MLPEVVPSVGRGDESLEVVPTSPVFGLLIVLGLRYGILVRVYGKAEGNYEGEISIMISFLTG